MIEKRILEDITYDDIHESQDNLCNFLFFTGYLKQSGKRMIEDDIYIMMKILTGRLMLFTEIK